MKLRQFFIASSSALLIAVCGTQSQALEIVDPHNNMYVYRSHGSDHCTIQVRTRARGVIPDRVVVVNKWHSAKDDAYWVELVDANGNLVVPAQNRWEHVVATNNRVYSYDLPIDTPLAMPIRHRIYEATSASPDLSNRGALLVDYAFPIESFRIGKCHAIIGPDNTAPVADAGLDQENLPSGSTVSLDGTSSSDPENDTLTYSWTQVSGPTVTLSDPTSATPGFTLPAGASTDPVVFELIVNDGNLDSAPDMVTITANAPPVADAGTDITGVNPNQDVTMDGTASADSDGDNITYLWVQISGLPVTLDDPTSPTPTFTVPPGKVDDPWVFELTVNDGTETSKSTVTVYHQGLSNKKKGG